MDLGSLRLSLGRATSISHIPLIHPCGFLSSSVSCPRGQKRLGLDPKLKCFLRGRRKRVSLASGFYSFGDKMTAEGHTAGMRSLSPDLLLCCPVFLCHEKVSPVKTRIQESGGFIYRESEWPKPHMLDDWISVPLSGSQVEGIITHNMKYVCWQEAEIILSLKRP